MMNEPAVEILAALARTTLVLAGSALVVALLLAASRCKSPRVHRAAWVLVLLQGWMFLHVTVPIPYETAPSPRSTRGSGTAAHQDATPPRHPAPLRAARPPDDAVNVLARELHQGNRNGRLFAIFALQDMGGEAEAAVPTLEEAFESDEDPTVRACAYLALASLEAAEPMSASALNTLLEGAEPQAVRNVLTALVPHPTSGGFVSSSIFQRDPASVQTVGGGYGGDMYGGGYAGMPSGGMGMYGEMPMPAARRRVLLPEAEPIVETLVEAATGENRATRTAAIAALGRILPATEAVTPGLIRAFEKGTAEDRRLILNTFQSFIPAPGTGGPAGMMSGMGAGMSPEPEGPAAFDVKEVTAELLETLDPRKPADLPLIGAVGARFTQSGPQVVSILEKAADDDNEEVRRTAKKVLEAMTRSRNMGGGSGMGMY